ncbi:MAG TPA: POTRA domain-containing protein [Candidatus Sulfotelmatobacter sp.]|nr:POTRA domain-containing protein [Candidatus Sulfotelmatobacter sp.]
MSKRAQVQLRQPLVSSLIALALTLCVCSDLPAAPLLRAGSPQASGDERKVIAIKATGSKRFASDDIAAASGLRIGTIAVDDDFKKAARRLAETGAFTDVAYTFTYSSAGTKLEFQVIDAAKFLPAHFEDFVWFSDDDLQKRLHERLPLYHGELPVGGRLPDLVSDVLQALLVENSVPGIVQYLRPSAQGGPTNAIIYSVSGILIRVRKIEFSGADAAELPLLEAAAQKLPDREYAHTALTAFAQRELLPVYHARGYLKAAFGLPVPKVVKLAPGESAADTHADIPNQTFVDVTFPVTPGLQYKISALEWSGNHEFPSDKLESLVHARPGQVANTVQLSADMMEIKKLYGSRGYITATLRTEATFDDAASTVVLHAEVKEESVYHMGELQFRGLDNSLTAKLRAAWKLHPGDVYDLTYIDQFLPQANKLLPTNFDWEPAVHLTANIRDKTVDVDIQYTVSAPK